MGGGSSQRVPDQACYPSTEKEITDTGIVGELRFAGPTIFPGYYKEPDLTAAAFDSEGYFRSGDLFSIEGVRKKSTCSKGDIRILLSGAASISVPRKLRPLL